MEDPLGRRARKGHRGSDAQDGPRRGPPPGLSAAQRTRGPNALFALRDRGSDLRCLWARPRRGPWGGVRAGRPQMCSRWRAQIRVCKGRGASEGAGPGRDGVRGLGRRPPTWLSQEPPKKFRRQGRGSRRGGRRESGAEEGGRVSSARRPARAASRPRPLGKRTPTARPPPSPRPARGGRGGGPA